MANKFVLFLFSKVDNFDEIILSLTVGLLNDKHFELTNVICRQEHILCIHMKSALLVQEILDKTRSIMDESTLVYDKLLLISHNKDGSVLTSLVDGNKLNPLNL
jgi:hypothetical protein